MITYETASSIRLKVKIGSDLIRLGILLIAPVYVFLMFYMHIHVPEHIYLEVREQPVGSWGLNTGP